MREAIIEPDLPIIDAHHHLWDLALVAGALAEVDHPFAEMIRLAPRYLLDEFLADTGTGHNVLATVYIQCTAFQRADGPDEMKPVGEVEFANGVAACSASGIYGPTRVCAGIVAHADLALGDRVAAVLEAELAAGNGRLCGIRHMGAQDADPAVLGPLNEIAHTPPGLFASSAFRDGFAHLGKLGLTFDAWVLEPQIDEVCALADAFPETPIVLDHAGTPLGIGRYAGMRDEYFPRWRAAIQELAERPNVTVKIGGLAMSFCGFEGVNPDKSLGSEDLAALWHPYVETCIEAFGPHRAMFESNFPVDRWGVDYDILWNAFKRMVAGASAPEKQQLFCDTAKTFYKLP